MSTAPNGTRPAGGEWDFLLRRIHSLAGLFPVGVYLVFHLATNASVLDSSATFQRQVDKIHDLGALVPFLEIFGIFIPIAFHAGLGLKIWLTSRSNVTAYPYGGNLRYTIQRVTGVIAVVFIVYHVWQLHRWAAPLGGGHFDDHDAAFSTAKVIQAHWFVSFIYALGVVSACFHLANGIWTMLITWGVTIGPNAQRKAGYVCAVFGVALTLVGLGALRGFGTLPIPPAETPLPGDVAVSTAAQAASVPPGYEKGPVYKLK